MVKIRLARYGKKKRPSYRIVVSDSRKDTQGTHLESIGHYDPISKPPVVEIDTERAKYWLGNGAQATITVHNLFVDHQIIDGPKIKASRTKPSSSDATENASGDAAPADSSETAPDAPTDSDEPTPAVDAPAPAEEVEEKQEATE